MKKFGLTIIIFSLILSTAIIKNSAKKTEDEIFTIKEKLLEYQSLYFEDELIQKDIKNIKLYKIKKKEKIIQNLKITKE